MASDKQVLSPTRQKYSQNTLRNPIDKRFIFHHGDITKKMKQDITQMGTTQLSRMIRVRNEIAESVGQLNELCRTGNVPSIVKGLDILIQAVERGESFGDRLTADRLTQLEDLVGSLGSGAIAPAAVEELTMQQLCKRFKIENASYQADWNHKTVEKWLQQETGWRYIGGDRFSSPVG